MRFRGTLPLEFVLLPTERHPQTGPVGLLSYVKVQTLSQEGRRGGERNTLFRFCNS